MTARDRSLVEHLAKVVMGWHRGSYENVYENVAWSLERWIAPDGVRFPLSWNPLEPSAATWQVWEKARRMGIEIELSGTDGGWSAHQRNKFAPDAQDADSGPRTICMAIYRATGGKELGT